MCKMTDWITDIFFKKQKEPTMSLQGADYWDNKWPKNQVLYSARGQYKMDIRNLILTRSYLLDRVVLINANKNETGTNYDEMALNLFRFVKSSLTYYTDDNMYGQPEFWQHPEITHQMGRGDCVAEYERIHTKDGIKTATELKEGDLVLSYNFSSTGGYEYRPIVKKWDKGVLPVKRVHLRNGQHIDVTEDHKMLARTRQDKSVYEECKLKDIDLTRWWKRKIPIAKKIPYEVVDIEWLDPDILFIIGHFLAEGWCAKDGKVGTSGYDLPDKIIPGLEEYGIPFTEGTNGSGVPVVNFLTSDFKEYLKTLKSNSFDIHLPEEIFHLPHGKLQCLLDGFYLGDGHNGNYPDKRGFKSNKQEVYSTSSERFARDLQRIGLHIGKTFHIWKQDNHGGAGKEPIYRVTHNPESHFLKDRGYSDMSEVSISYIEDIGEVQCYDWEVEQTHNFFFENGTCTHNCEDGAILLASLLRIAGIPAYRVKLCAGWVKSKKGIEGHAYVIYLADDNKWYTLDWCYWPDASDFNFKKTSHEKNSDYQEIWWTANDENTWAQTQVTV